MGNDFDKKILDRHLKCFGEGDISGILSDYAPGAVMFAADGPLKGIDAIRLLSATAGSGNNGEVDVNAPGK
jgi:hypothetical protein